MFFSMLLLLSIQDQAAMLGLSRLADRIALLQQIPEDEKITSSKVLLVFLKSRVDLSLRSKRFRLHEIFELFASEIRKLSSEDLSELLSFVILSPTHHTLAERLECLSFGRKVLQERRPHASDSLEYLGQTLVCLQSVGDLELFHYVDIVSVFRNMEQTLISFLFNDKEITAMDFRAELVNSMLCSFCGHAAAMQFDPPFTANQFWRFVLSDIIHGLDEMHLELSSFSVENHIIVFPVLQELDVEQEYSWPGNRALDRLNCFRGFSLCVRSLWTDFDSVLVSLVEASKNSLILKLYISKILDTDWNTSYFAVACICDVLSIPVPLQECLSQFLTSFDLTDLDSDLRIHGFFTVLCAAKNLVSMQALESIAWNFVLHASSYNPKLLADIYSCHFFTSIPMNSQFHEESFETLSKSLPLELLCRSFIHAKSPLLHRCLSLVLKCDQISFDVRLLGQSTLDVLLNLEEFEDKIYRSPLCSLLVHRAVIALDDLRLAHLASNLIVTGHFEVALYLVLLCLPIDSAVWSTSLGLRKLLTVLNRYKDDLLVQLAIAEINRR
jgi:hypothetical protein